MTARAIKTVTAESVTEGHPDKLADLVADSILDACLEQDKNSRVACEVLLTAKKAVIAGEITTNAKVDYKEIAQKVIREVGHPLTGVEFDIQIHTQSKDIEQAVFNDEEQGAGDQGIVYGYATSETPQYLPLAYVLATKLSDRLTQVYHESVIQGLKPDGKTQVTVSYERGRPRVQSVIISAQHACYVHLEGFKEQIKRHVIVPAIADYIDADTEFIINPSGTFVLGGFEADTGLTGRKLMVDTYGGLVRHGGGAFSGKDPSKVDRSGAYMARYIAKNVVAAGLTDECEVSIAYAIGKAEPTAFGCEFNVKNPAVRMMLDKAVLVECIKDVFDMRPRKIIEALRLKDAKYRDTAVGGHFMKKWFSWEQTDKAEELVSAVIAAMAKG